MNTKGNNNNDDGKGGCEISELDCRLGSFVVVLFVFSVIVLFQCKNYEIGELCGDALWNTTLVVFCLHVAVAIFFGVGKCIGNAAGEALTLISIFLVFCSLTGEFIILCMQITKKDCMIFTTTDGSTPSSCC